MFEQKYSGTTVNERLYASGLIDSFDKALAFKDVKLIIEILKKIELDEESINAIIESLNLEKL